MVPVELRPHQVKAVGELSNGKILRGDPGTGKTITSLAYYFLRVCGGTDLNDPGTIVSPKDIYVFTTARKRDSLDWQRDAAKLSISGDVEKSAHGIKLTVDSWNNVHKYQEVKNAFFIFDEQRVVGGGSWAKAFIKIAKSNEWILLSATPGDTWLDYIPVMVANGFYKNRTEFKREHVVYSTHTKFPKVERYINTGRLVRHRNHILVEMPYVSHTKRNLHEVDVAYDAELFEQVVKKRWHVYEERPIRDVAELFSVMRKVVNTDSSRLEQIRELQKKHPKLIVFYNFDYELEMLRTLANDISEENDECLKNAGPTSRTHESKSRPCSERSSTTGSGITSNTSKRVSDLSPTDEADISGLRKSLSGSTTQSHVTPTTEPTASTVVHPERLAQASAVFPDASAGETTAGSSEGAFAIAEWNGHKHQEIPDTDEWIYLVQYVAGAEAWNCVETNATVFYSLTYSYKNFEQAQGRIDRLNTPFTDLHYYILISKSAIDRAVMKALKGKRNFNERDFVQKTSKNS